MAHPAANSQISVDRDEPIGLYVHWPFCKAKCPYCDFNSHVVEAVDHPRWCAALVRELQTMAARIGPRRVASVFFGGGTPSLMEPDTVDAILSDARRLFRFNNGCEITLEANPTSVEAKKLDGFRDAGITRVSLGVQALSDDVLRFLGREHTAAEALAAVRVARNRFENVSFDLIYARPDQSITAWREELVRALDLGLDHLSLYQLTIEPTTPFHARHARGEFTIPDEEAGAALFEATQEIMASAGLPAYEISNHARPGAACQHNLIYWSYQDYLGIGPGAHGRITNQHTRGLAKIATRTHRAPSIWLDRVEAHGHALVDDLPIPAEDALIEATLVGLRLIDGLPRTRWRALFGVEPEVLFAPDTLAPLIEGGFLEVDSVGLRATAAGRQRLDAVTARLIQGACPQAIVPAPDRAMVNSTAARS
ncbi:MAG: coproporphyrinogen III oxidase [Alphaproteobacteria bacterium]|nr:coproporphyrinogen III oxidase [Alphaproteobacteria bacterium]